MLRPVGIDALSSLRVAATVNDAALDLALLRVGILAPADLTAIRALVTRPGCALRASCNVDGHSIVEVTQHGTVVGQIHHDGRVLVMSHHHAA
jgi:hypothetical protein